MSSKEIILPFDQIPLYRQMHEDKFVEITPRNVDLNWIYNKAIPSFFGQIGFNPFTRKVFYGEKSKYMTFLKSKQTISDIRMINQGDYLVKEILFLLHDYLHVWAYNCLQQICPPHISFGKRDMTKDDIEDFAFCHLLSEAAATVGLDYWYLSDINLDEILKVGTNQTCLTVNFRSNDSEYKRLTKDFDSNNPSFFEKIAKFYCSGSFEGFNARDILKSPKLYLWLDHEITYSELQRKYIRQWLHYINGTLDLMNEAKLTKAIEVKKKWKVDVMKKLGLLLWEKVKENKLHKGFEKNFYDITKNIKNNKTFDARFCNLNYNINNANKFFKNEYYYSQLLMSRISLLPSEMISEVRTLFHQKQFNIINFMVEKLPFVGKNQVNEPASLFILP